MAESEPVDDQQTQETDAGAPEGRIAELEAEASHLRENLQERDASIEHLTSRLEERQSALSRLEEQAAAAVARYRDALLASAPEVPQEMVAGQTVEEIDDSMAQARQMVERVRSRMETQTAAQRIPSGAPPRSAPDVSSLSPAAKIAYGLRRSEG